ncbi:MAG TPA: hypothetical protein VGG33_25235 [Polyangia bacterium]
MALVPLQMIVYLRSPPPDTVSGWFTLFQRSPFVGLVDLDLPMVIDNVLLSMTFLGLFFALRRRSPSLMIMAITFELLAIATYFASNPALEMWSLSRRYADASAPADRAALLAAGEAVIASWQGSAFTISYILGALATLLTSAAMVRSLAFGRLSGVVGLSFGALSLIPASAGRIGLIFSLLSLVPMLLWLGLVASKLGRLAGATTARVAS